MITKIMFLIDQYHGPQAGTEGQLLQLLCHLDRSRYEPGLTLLRDSDYVQRKLFPCPVRVLGIARLASIRAVGGMLQYAFALRRENYRLVHCFFNDSALIAPFFLKLFGIRVLVSRRDMGFWYTPQNLFVLRFVARFVDRYVANSHMVKRHVQEKERVRDRKITVIYNGYAPYSESARGRSFTPVLTEIGDHDPVVGIVANLRPIKRIDTLIEAFAIVGKQNPVARLVIVGDSTSDQARSTLDSLNALAGRFGIRERIIFTGQVENPLRYIKKFTVAVLCSESEGFSNSIIEYLQAGRPVICTDTGGNAEIIQDGRNGFLVPVGDSGALAARLVLLLSDSALSRRLSLAGRETVRSYTHTRMVAAHMTCYDQVLSGLLPSRSTN